MPLGHYPELADYRRSVATLYAAVRDSRSDPAATCRQFRLARDRLFRTHPQAALSAEQQAHFKGLSYYEYDPSFRFLLPIDPNVEPGVLEVDLPEEGRLRMQRFGKIHFLVDGQRVSLSLFWLLGYGGGIFLPFRDLTNQATTFGGGRYLLDTLKHADLGQVGDQLVIDFNYAYNPSCAYQPRWVCPLAPPENWLSVAIPVGERTFTDQ